MRRTAVKLVESPDKPLSKFTDADQRIFRAPDVEAHLTRIKRALALCAVFHNALANGPDECFAEGVEADASDALSEMCEHAFKSAHALSEGLPGEIQTLRVVVTEDEDGGAR